jgi:hypothetical protein
MTCIPQAPKRGGDTAAGRYIRYDAGDVDGNGHPGERAYLARNTLIQRTGELTAAVRAIGKGPTRARHHLRYFFETNLHARGRMQDAAKMLHVTREELSANMPELERSRR